MTYPVEISDGKSVILNDGLTYVPVVGSFVVVNDIRYRVKRVTQVIKKNPMAQVGYSQVQSLFKVRVRKAWFQNENESQLQRGHDRSGRDSLALETVGV